MKKLKALTSYLLARNLVMPEQLDSWASQVNQDLIWKPDLKGMHFADMRYSAVVLFERFADEPGRLMALLAAPNLLQLLSAKLKDSHDTGLPTGQQYALVILFLGTRYDQFAATLARFNALLPFPDLERAQRRAQQLFKLEAEKWELPSAGALPRWGQMPLERCTVTKAASQALSSQLAALEGYAADSSPMADLAALAARKATQAQAHDRKLAELQQLLTGNAAETTMQCRLIGPGNGTELSTQLLEGQAPGHEWGICAGMVLVGSRQGLSFVQEMIGL